MLYGLGHLFNVWQHKLFWGCLNSIWFGKRWQSGRLYLSSNRYTALGSNFQHVIGGDATCQKQKAFFVASTAQPVLTAEWLKCEMSSIRIISQGEVSMQCTDEVTCLWRRTTIKWELLHMAHTACFQVWTVQPIIWNVPRGLESKAIFTTNMWQLPLEAGNVLLVARHPLFGMMQICDNLQGLKGRRNMLYFSS